MGESFMQESIHAMGLHYNYDYNAAYCIIITIVNFKVISDLGILGLFYRNQ